jgi:hypothetical protein
MKRTLEDVKAIISEHRDELRRVHRIKAISVFGSYVRGEQKRGSDLDLLAEFQGSISLIDLIGAEQYLSKILKVKVDLIPKEDVRPELKAGILKEAVTV